MLHEAIVKGIEGTKGLYLSADVDVSNLAKNIMAQENNIAIMEALRNMVILQGMIDEASK